MDKVIAVTPEMDEGTSKIGFYCILGAGALALITGSVLAIRHFWGGPQQPAAQMQPPASQFVASTPAEQEVLRVFRKMQHDQAQTLSQTAQTLNQAAQPLNQQAVQA